jgi:alpha-N-acetylglucosaminidase
MARSLGQTEAEKDLYEWNARTQITVWGNRMAADEGGLHDYAHKEWAGILRDFYYKRWKIWIDSQIAGLMGRQVPKIDFYSVEEPWTRESKIVDHQ